MGVETQQAPVVDSFRTEVAMELQYDEVCVFPQTHSSWTRDDEGAIALRTSSRVNRHEGVELTAALTAMLKPENPPQLPSFARARGNHVVPILCIEVPKIVTKLDLTSSNDPTPASSPMATRTATLLAMMSQGLDSTPVPPPLSLELSPVRTDLGLAHEPAYAYTDQIRHEVQELTHSNFEEHDESKPRLTTASAPTELVQRLPDSDSDVATPLVRHHRNSAEQLELNKRVRPASHSDDADKLSLDEGARIIDDSDDMSPSLTRALPRGDALSTEDAVMDLNFSFGLAPVVATHDPLAYDRHTRSRPGLEFLSVSIRVPD
ncbi:Aste57867_25537 [Aphanomyces stellatus]|uniref:Aste57867_25537 protein n=1 Tax=Aphanomyces stellatus TaxID=120398 RepID=A0A485LVU4_9STRA|nr:hypothetical protein As57867_025458 [Aphanomyces stellatus]VFU02160.1 Aste57867_25537 [Aphanomyces stellatus]